MTPENEAFLIYDNWKYEKRLAWK